MGCAISGTRVCPTKALPPGQNCSQMVSPVPDACRRSHLAEVIAIEVAGLVRLFAFPLRATYYLLSNIGIAGNLATEKQM